MKVLFICGSTEQGRDGVGDYTRRLSLELVNHGIQVAIAAINDRHIQEIQHNVVTAGAAEVNLLRLPAGLPEDKRFNLLKELVDQFNPDWLSLQYVPFSYHPKGLGFGLAKRLKKAGGGRKWEIMVHEIAVGMPEGSSLKEMLWGKAQKHLASSLISTLKPAVVHTQTTVYQKQLEKFGASVITLPLFSNIPLLDAAQVKSKLAGGTKTTGIDLLVFATVQLGAPIKQLAAEAAEYEKANQVKLRMVFLGRGGRAQEEWIKEWTAAGLTTLQLGEQPEEKISEILSSTTYGIYSTPLVLTGKSGAVAAMREHGVHLLCVSGKWEARGIKIKDNPFGIVDYKGGNFGELFTTVPDFSLLPTVPKVAEQFKTDLLTH